MKVELEVMIGFQNVPAVSVSAYRTRSESETSSAEMPGVGPLMSMTDPLNEEGFTAMFAGPVEFQPRLGGFARARVTLSQRRPYRSRTSRDPITPEKLAERH